MHAVPVRASLGTLLTGTENYGRACNSMSLTRLSKAMRKGGHWPALALVAVSCIAVATAAYQYALFHVAGGSVLPTVVAGAAGAAVLVLLAARMAGEADDSEQASAGEVFDALPLGVAVYGPGGALRLCNDSYRRMLGDPPAAAPADGERNLADGRRVSLRRHQLAEGGMLVTAADITAIAAGEEEMRRSAGRVRDLMALVADWTWETDILHRFTQAAATDGRADVGLSRLVGRGPADIAGDEGEVADAANALLAELDRGMPIRGMRLFLPVGGQVRPVEFDGVPRHGEAGNFLGYHGIARWVAEGRLDRPAPALPPEPPASPEAPPEPAEVIDPDGRAPLEGPAGPILLVDDNPGNRRLGLSILNRMGYRADAAEGGRQAVDAVRSGGYSAVLMDIWMPEMDGFEAAAEIRKLPPPHGTIPVIAMTAHAGPDERKRCLDAGMAEHIEKPIDRNRLSAVLLRYAGRPGPRAAGLPAANGEGEDTAKDKAEGLVSDEVLAQLRNDAGESLVNELIGAYMAETDDRLVRIRTALDAGDNDGIAAEAHSMKSSSGTFGALQLQTLAARIEAAAMQGDSDGLAAAHAELPQLVDETWKAFAMRGLHRG